jgi:hypothetical protein
VHACCVLAWGQTGSASDGEWVENEYDQSGQPKRLKNNGGLVYVSDARYDLFGRATLIRHGNLLDDERTYYDAPGQNRHRRLHTLKTHVVGSSYLDLRYGESYTARGQIGEVVDNIHASGALSNRATYGYDALGRLTGLTGAGASGLETSYAHDSYGRITQKASRNIHYHDAARPHWPSEVHAGTTTTPVAHDLNGNRTRAKGGDPDYTYDAWDRLKTIAVPSLGSVQFVHDYSGRRAAKVVNNAERGRGKKGRKIDTFVRRRLRQHARRRSQRPFRPPKGVGYFKHFERMGLVYLAPWTAQLPAHA